MNSFTEDVHNNNNIQSTEIDESTELIDLSELEEEFERTQTFTIKQEEAGERIDKWLQQQLPNLSRSQIQLHISNAQIEVNGEPTKANYKIRNLDHIMINIPEPEGVSINPENIPLEIVYEDSDVIVINKPRGMVVHPAQGHYSGTLVNALLFHCKDLSGINGELRPGIVHRIDKDTTGLIVAAKNDFTHKHLSEQFKQHSIKRKYVALVHGLIPNKEGTIIAPIGRHKTFRKKMAVDVEHGKAATTHFTVIQYFIDYTLVELTLETGRTHQIRVHLSYIGHPVAGDPVYGFRKSVQLAGQALHAKVLGFVHPRSNQFLEFSADLPNDFKEVLTTI